MISTADHHKDGFDTLGENTMALRDIWRSEIMSYLDDNM